MQALGDEAVDVAVVSRAPQETRSALAPGQKDPLPHATQVVVVGVVRT
jgi:hypothetical protein